jgi:hypothetical protein
LLETFKPDNLQANSNCKKYGEGEGHPKFLLENVMEIENYMSVKD